MNVVPKTWMVKLKMISLFRFNAWTLYNNQKNIQIQYIPSRFCEKENLIIIGTSKSSGFLQKLKYGTSMKDRMLNLKNQKWMRPKLGVLLLRKLFYATRRIKKGCFKVKTMYTMLCLAFLKTQSLENNVHSRKKKRTRSFLRISYHNTHLEKSRLKKYEELYDR